MMSITKPYPKNVRFTNSGGYDGEPQAAIAHGLKPEEVYEVSSVEVHSWHSYVYLKNYPGVPFNTVMFENA